MRLFICAPLAALALTTIALAADGPPPPRFDREATEDYLRQLDNAQLRLLRRATRGCSSPATRTIKPERDPCVISSTDKAVADTGNPDLQSFHTSLPASERYDENRSSTVWRAWLQPH